MAEAYKGILSLKGVELIRKAYRTREKKVAFNGEVLRITRAKDKRYLLVKGNKGTVGHVEIEKYSGFVTTGKEGEPLV